MALREDAEQYVRSERTAYRTGSRPVVEVEMFAGSETASSNSMHVHAGCSIVNSGKCVCMAASSSSSMYCVRRQRPQAGTSAYCRPARPRRHRCEAPKQRSVVLDVDARHAQVLHCRAAGQQLLPVDQSTAVDHQTRDRCRALKRQPPYSGGCSGRPQFQRLQRRRKRRCRKRSTRSEGDAPQRGVTRHERL